MTLSELADRVEAATGPDRELDLDIVMAINPEYENIDEGVRRFLVRWGGQPHYTASLDAAMTLVPALSEWNLYSPDLDAGESKFSCEIAPTHDEWKTGRSAVHACAATPALALCAAALRARAKP